MMTTVRAERAPTGSATKFRYLLWKNFKIQSRHKWHTILELFLPVLIFVLLAYMRAQSGEHEWRPPIIDEPTTPINIEIPSTYTLVYAPSNPYTDDFMRKVSELVKLPPPIATNDAKALEEKVLSNTTIYFAGVQFYGDTTRPSKQLSYSLRFPPGFRQSPARYWPTNVLFPDNAFEEPRHRPDKCYHFEGFLTLQNAMAQILAQTFNTTIPDINLKALPFPGYSIDPVLTLSELLIPFMFIISFNYAFVNTIRFITIEKEKQLKEFMQMHGMSSWLHWSSWLVRTMIMQCITICCIVALVSWSWFGGAVAVFPASNPACLFVVFTAYSISLITLCFFVSSFCSKAKTAATLSTAIWYLSFAPYFFTQSNYAHMNSVMKILISFMPNTAIAIGLRRIVHLESMGLGLQWSTFLKTATVYESLSVFWIVLVMLFDAAVFFAIAIYIENIFPGSYGVSKPWYFIFQRKYWMRRKYQQFESHGGGEEALHGEGTEQQSPLNFEKEPSNRRAGIEIRGLCKRFDSDKLAVNKVSMNMYDDQITVLLGHNGAGKSTTIAILSGMTEATSGTALINGSDIRQDTDAARNSMGFCPQHNVLFDELTVGEHIELFSLLKGATAREAKEEVRKYVRLLNLESKVHALSNTLSGGMKRKLQMGIALCGDSKVVLVDEATSGMDPAARREMWDILQREKKGRTVLLTTHFMDEADVLGDRIAILVDGLLKCCGTTFFLKKRFGTGYHLICAKDTGCSSEHVTELLRQHLPRIRVHDENDKEITYHLPDHHMQIFKDIFADLEQNEQRLRLRSFGIALTTMEEIFLQLGKNNPDGGDQVDGRSNSTDTEARLLLCDESYYLTGWRLWLNQSKAMFKKRALCLLRSYKSYVAHNIFVMVVLALLLFPIDKLFKTENLPPLRMSLDYYKVPRVIIDYNNNNSVIDQFESYVKSTTQARIVGIPSNPTRSINIDKAILRLAEGSMEEYNSEYILGLSHLADDTYLGWFNHQMYHTSALVFNMIHNVLLGAGFSIDVINAPLKFLTDLPISGAQGFGILFGMIVGFSLSFYSSTFIMYYIKEKETRSKFLQYVSGVNIFVFWGCSIIWDIIIFLPTIALMVIMCLISQANELSTWRDLAPICFILVLFQYANSAFVSLASLIFTKPTTGNTVLSFLNVLLLTVYSINNTFAFMAPWVEYIVRAYPLNTFCSAIFKLSANNVVRNHIDSIRDAIDEDQMKLVQDQLTSRMFSWEDGIGVHIVYMLGTGTTLLLVLVLIEMGLFKRYVAFVLNNLPWYWPKPQVIDEPIDDDVNSEKARIAAMSLEELKHETIALQNVSKFYGNFVAVNEVSFTVKRAECFGLLGNNGAGKTSIFKMFTGEEHISRGEIYLNGYHQRTELHHIFKNIGYCPQFDALLDELTCRETLEIFSLIRGVSATNIRLHTLNAARNLEFLKYIDKKVRGLSGGNKRKLSTAIALIGNPDIVLLDEPTTGMDPATKRNLWNVIIALRDSGKSIVLTSHSMEECEALCTNLTVMVNGNLKCLGSTQHLKNKFTKGFELKIKVKQDAQQMLNLMDIKNFVIQTFPGAVLKEEYQGLMTYSIPATNIKWSSLFGTMENAKNDLQFEDYSINQTSLEQVVLSFVKNQRSA